MTPEEIKNLRKSRHETQAQFAKTVGTFQHHVSRWENGVRRPTGLYLKALLELKRVQDNKGEGK